MKFISLCALALFSSARYGRCLELADSSFPKDEAVLGLLKADLQNNPQYVLLEDLKSKEESAAKVPTETVATGLSIQLQQPIEPVAVVDPPGPQRPTVADDPCTCPMGSQILIKGGEYCQSDLGETVGSAKGKPIYLSGEHIVTKPISYNYDIDLEGKSCFGQRPTVMASFKNKHGLTNGAIFLLTTADEKQEIELKNINFTRDPNNSAYGMLLSATMDGNAFDSGVGSRLNLKMDKCDVTNFLSKQLGGSVISLPFVKELKISRSKFEKNEIVQLADNAYGGGGGAIWIVTLLKGDKFLMDDVEFIANKHGFWHGLGGAIHIGNVGGDVFIDGEFRNNVASDGGAINLHSMEEYSEIKINGKFIANYAVPETKWDPNFARGGAIKLAEIRGKTKITGEFRDNWSGGRGGAIASVRWWGKDAVIYLGGTFVNNTAVESGAVWDNIQSNKRQPNGSTNAGNMCKGAKFVILRGSKFKDNEARADERLNTKKRKASILYAPSMYLEILEDDYMKGKKIRASKKLKKDCKKCKSKEADVEWNNGHLIVTAKLDEQFPCEFSGNEKYKRTFMEFVRKSKYSEKRHGLNKNTA